MIEVIVLPVMPVVSREDPEWLKKLFMYFLYDIDLSLDRFPRIGEWPEAEPGRPLSAVQFRDEEFPDFSAVDRRLAAEGLERTVPPHFACIAPRFHDFWLKRQSRRGPSWIYASSPEAVWRGNDDALFLLGVDLFPGGRKLCTHRIDDTFNDLDGFLVCQ